MLNGTESYNTKTSTNSIYRYSKRYFNNLYAVWTYKGLWSYGRNERPCNAYNVTYKRALRSILYAVIFYYYRLLYIIHGGKKYIWKNIKTLLIPSILLFLLSEYYKVTFFQGIIDLSPFRKLFDWLTVGGPWFIIALFWAKLLYYLICKLGIKYQAALLLILYLFALACNFFNITNYQWFQHTLLLMPYLFVGKICRENWMKIEPKLKYIAYFGLVTILLENILSQCGVFSLPEQDFAICISFKNFPLHIVNSLSGTAFVIYASKLIGTNNFIQTMGTGTLLCYLWNGIVYRTIVRGLMSGYNTDNIIICSLFHLVALTLCYFIFYNLIKLIYQHKYLKWIVGKWKVFII